MSKPIIMFVSDIIDLCVRARIRACVWKGNLQAFLSRAVRSALYPNRTQQRHSGKHSASVECVLRRMQLQRSNYARFESTDTPMSKTGNINHTQSLVGKYAFFSILLRAWQYNIKA